MPRRGKREDLQWFRDAARRRAETLDEMLRGSLVTRVRRGSTCSRGLQPSVEGVRDGEGLGWAEGSSCRRAGGLCLCVCMWCVCVYMQCVYVLCACVYNVCVLCLAVGMYVVCVYEVWCVCMCMVCGMYVICVVCVFGVSVYICRVCVLCVCV